MTRAAQVTSAVSAIRKAGQAPRSRSEPAQMTFLVCEDNGGSYRWTIVADGERLVQSAGFASYEEAKGAAQIVRDSARSASFEDRFADQRPTDLPARRDAAARAR